MSQPTTIITFNSQDDVRGLEMKLSWHIAPREKYHEHLEKISEFNCTCAKISVGTSVWNSILGLWPSLPRRK